MKRSINKSTVYLTLGLVLLAGLAGACSGGANKNSGGDSNAARTGNAVVVTETVNVTTTEMAFDLNPMPTKAGRITFVVTNRGQIEHNLIINANGRDYATSMIPPGASESLTVDLAPGTYNFVCGVFGHNFAGMQGSFTLR